MNNKDILESALITGEKKISQIYKEAFMNLMKSKKITTDKEFLEQFTLLISSRYVMNMEVIAALPTNIDEFWDLTRKLKIYREFKAYLFNKKPEKKQNLVKLEESKRRKLIFINPK